MATIRPSPTTTSEAATAITASAKICPAPPPCSRAKPIRARLAPLSMISSESRTISGLRRRSTPSAPVANRNADTAIYQATSGPFTRLLVQAPRVRAEDDAADGGNEQHDRGDLEGEQMIGEEQAADLPGAAERRVDLRLV